MKKYSIKVTIVVPTRNSEKYLVRVLESIKSQTHKNIEIIIVDNNSIDKTRGIAESYGVKFITCGPERSTQKNIGATKAEGDYILFLDSDALLTPNVVADCVEKGNNGFSMVVIPESHEGSGFWSECKMLERKLVLGDDDVECPWFFNKKDFLECVGYNTSMYAGEDWDLFLRMRNAGYKHTRIKSFINHQIGVIKIIPHLKKRYTTVKISAIL